MARLLVAHLLHYWICRDHRSPRISKSAIWIFYWSEGWDAARATLSLRWHIPSGRRTVLHPCQEKRLDRTHQESRRSPALALDPHHSEFPRANRGPCPRRFPIQIQLRRTSQPWPCESHHMAADRFRSEWSLRTIHPQETTSDEEDLQLLKTNTPSHNRTTVLRCHYPYDHSLR